MRYKLILILVTSIIFCACDNNPISKSEYFANASMNGEYWEADDAMFYKHDSSTISIRLSKNSSEGFLRELIRFRRVKLIDTFQDLKHNERGQLGEANTSYFDTFISDGDVSTEFYDLFEMPGTDNYVIINSISDDGTEIEGEFQLNFALSSQSSLPLNGIRPDTIKFKNGIFKAELRE